MEKEIIVSISCTTYNHEKYIGDAIESFLLQKANFKYEILIHDDASTDRTANIIREYEKKYPDLIKPIYQSENQYSKGIKVGKFNTERAKGKYIALCEGDDYWIDPYKLHKQVDYMETHPEFSLCVHAAYIVDTMKRKLDKQARPSIGNKVFEIEEVITMGHKFATNSIMYPSIIGSSKPLFYENAPIGDYPMVIYLALEGRVFYIDEYMSCYRVGVSNSWTSLMKSDKTKSINNIYNIINMFEEIDKHTQYKYENIIKIRINKYKFELLVICGNYRDIRKGEYDDIYRGLGFLTKAKLYIKEYFPGFVKAYKSFQRKYRSCTLR